jgi:pimeloyl-ACP methyl ester carboxylesterase
MGLHIERYGSGEQYVFIHGAGGSSSAWYFQKELENAMEIILLDLPGHGKSRGPAPDTIEGIREAVYETLCSLNIAQCFIAGHSMGGAAAMSLALAYPSLVKGLILIGTGARLRVAPEFLEGIQKDKEKTVRMIVEVAFGRKTPPALKESGVREMMKCDALTILSDYHACDRFDIMATAARISAPTLILCAQSDLLTPPKYSEYLNSQIKGSRIELIEGAGHLMMLEKPAEVNKLIREFVDAPVAGSARGA